MRKDVVVIADKKEPKYARQMVHGISKLERANAHFLTLKQFSDSEMTMSGKQRKVFIGKSSISESYIGLIDKIYDRHGVVWGYDGATALLYVEQKPKNMKAFVEEMNETLRRVKGRSRLAEVQTDVGLIVQIGIYALPFVLLRTRLRGKRLREAQYSLGIVTFLEQGLHEFLDIGDTHENIQ